MTSMGNLVSPPRLEAYFPKTGVRVPKNIKESQAQSQADNTKLPHEHIYIYIYIIRKDKTILTLFLL